MVLVALVVLSTSACDKLRRPSSLPKPKSTQAPEYDCRKHSKDKICEVPYKDKIVLYCYAKPIPKVVRYREECVK